MTCVACADTIEYEGRHEDIIKDIKDAWIDIKDRADERRIQEQFCL